MLYPKVSVVIPTYKRAHFLSRAIDSVLAQTYPNVEVIVVDDNANDAESRESTKQTMRTYENNEKVRYILSSEKLGGGPARNLGIDSADGEYITFLDDDDAYEPPKIEMQLKFMMMHNLDFCFSDLHLYNHDGTKIVEHRTRPYVKSWDPEHLLKMHILYSISGTDCYMAKKELLLNIGGFRDVKVGQEFLLMWDVLEAAQKDSYKVGYYPNSYIRMYLHKGERVSVGHNKIAGEEDIYKLKCSKKHTFNKKQARYIDFRHYMVLCVACKRSFKPAASLKHLLTAFNISPYDFFNELIIDIKKKNTFRRK